MQLNSPKTRGARPPDSGWLYNKYVVGRMSGKKKPACTIIFRASKALFDHLTVKVNNVLGENHVKLFTGGHCLSMPPAAICQFY